MAIRVAVDAMGGDRAPAVVVEGVVQAAQKASGDLELLLFGPAGLVEEELARHPNTDGLPIRVVDAPEIITMAESPTAALKGKPNSSIHLGLGAHKQGVADAFISAGNTGAVMAASLFILGRLENVLRPSLVSAFPSIKGGCLVLDVGSNVDCKPEHLLQFAHMGSIYAELIQKRKNPVVALMNIGEEPGKGNELAKAAFTLLSEASGLNFRGNIEGRDLLQHAADVIVCDGFVGNILLKFGESVATVFPQMIGQEMHRLGLSPEEQALVSKVFRGVQRPFNYEEQGGAPLLGVAGDVMIGHGGSSPRAIARMVEAAAEIARQDVAGSIAAVLSV